MTATTLDDLRRQAAIDEAYALATARLLATQALNVRAENAPTQVRK